MVLSCRNLHRSFGKRVAVEGLSFDVVAGEAYGLLGPNGAGKTTTIRMVVGILSADRGQVMVGERPVGERRGRGDARSLLGYVPQELALLPTLTVAENLVFWAKLHGLGRRARAARVESVLAMAGLVDRARERVDRCSGGMQRRLNLAVALLHEPALLVLDEPTVGVDAQSRAALLDGLRALRDAGTAVLYTSHYMDEVERLCDRVGVIDHGRMVTEGRPAELLGARPELADLESLFLELTGHELRD